MIQMRRIGHITFETTDVERQIDYYTNVVGLVLAERDKHSAYLSTRVGQLAVQLDSGAEARCTSLSFEVTPGMAHNEIVRQLTTIGIASELRSDSAPGMKSSVTSSTCSLRRPRSEENPDRAGAAAPRPGPQRCDLSCQSGRPRGRILHRTRPDEG